MKPVSRRRFLQCIGQAGAASAVARLLDPIVAARADGSPTTLPAIADLPSTGSVPASLKSIVTHIRAREVVADPQIHEPLLREMIEEGLRLATGAASVPDAWNSLLKPDDVIAIKFNQIGSKALATTVPFATQLVESLTRAGFAPDRIMLIEAPELATRQLKTRPPVFGFAGGEADFGSGKDELAAVLQEVTAIINVPFLKTHNLAVMTGCLKNLSHAFIRRPKLCHANACAPYVGDIVALPQIRSKLRVNIINALRAVFNGGPDPVLDHIWIHGGILISTDPVAADNVGVDILNDERVKRGLSPIGDRQARIPHIRAAAQRGVGTNDQDYITLLAPPLF